MSSVAVVTGGASGIGLTLTKHLLTKGWKVVVADINIEAGESLEKELGSNVIFQHTDVSDWESQVALFKRAVEWGNGRLDFLAANAGINGGSATSQIYEPSGEVEPDKPDTSTISVNLTGVIYSIHLFKFYAKKTTGEVIGNIVITASVFGVYPLQTSPYYAASKHGVCSYCNSKNIP
jgi:15-hydroxyprostaglandin dehydrogenase (NAD)